MARLDVDWQNSTGVRINQGEVNDHLLEILRRLGHLGTVKLEISVVGDKAIQELNNQFLGHDQPTDVLSFASPVQENVADQPIGSVVLSIPTAKKQAKEAGVNLIDEVKMLASHGLLHLLGYHHH